MSQAPSHIVPETSLQSFLVFGETISKVFQTQTYYFSKFFPSSKKIVNLQTGIEVWCNGSTTDFGSASSGSSPDISTNKKSPFLPLYPILKKQGFYLSEPPPTSSWHTFIRFNTTSVTAWVSHIIPTMCASWKRRALTCLTVWATVSTSSRPKVSSPLS